MAFVIDLSKKNETGGRIVLPEKPREPFIVRVTEGSKNSPQQPPVTVNNPPDIKHD